MIKKDIVGKFYFSALLFFFRLRRYPINKRDYMYSNKEKKNIRKRIFISHKFSKISFPLIFYSIIVVMKNIDSIFSFFYFIFFGKNHVRMRVYKYLNWMREIYLQQSADNHQKKQAEISFLFIFFLDLRIFVRETKNFFFFLFFS